MTAPHQRQPRDGADFRLLRAATFAAVCVALSAGGHVLASCAAVPLWTLGVGFLVVFAVALPLAGRARSLPGIAALLAAGQLGLHALFGLGQHGTAATSAAGGDASLVARAARLVCGAGASTITPAQAHRILTTAGLGPGGAGGSGAAGAGHRHGGATAADSALDSLAAGTPGGGGMGSMGGMGLVPSLPMIVAHVLAALAAGWLLRRGDLALLRLVRLADGAHGVAEGALVRALRSALTLVRALRAGLPGAPETAGPRAPRTALLVPAKPRTVALEDAVIRRGPPAGARDVELAA
ncbi:hypothetical protein [Streptomyces venezuelae]|uniref:Integral membrane protein n=1 Tax=Streptomyces venezuelae TaxID=54571 RepID=A0A5P2C3Z3_STRVZ|nr:hypothetical protein [Streptomyces venezuelae]QES35389.1 hypothetical protein DEJ48_19890 [Streptomyces venezuelae]